jgi:hypothetical protein
MILICFSEKSNTPIYFNCRKNKMNINKALCFIQMKRKRENTPSENTSSKRPACPESPSLSPEPQTTPFLVSGTEVRNYIIKDPLVDWLKLYKTPKVSKTPRDFFKFITQRGNDFEKELVKYFIESKLDIVSISDKITEQSCRDTVLQMKLGTPIIHSAPFQNNKKHIKGIIDFLVRSDYLHNIVKDVPLPEHLRHFAAPNLSGNYHYVVIDAKFSTLPFRADGVHLLNSGAYPAYKAQLWIYTNGIADIQGYTSRYAYILGRRWNYVSKGERFSGLQCLDKLGTIDYQGVDNEYIQRTQDAMDWLKDLRTFGKSWTTNPPSRPELYPNMCVDSGEWNADKKEIADELGDITQLWYCGIRNREKALQNGITSWRDSRCCSATIGMNGTRASIVDKIIDINRQEVDKIRPKKITTTIHDWQTVTNEIFVDFETFCDIFAPLDDLPYQPKTDKIFMIGVWSKERVHNVAPCSDAFEWTYTNFVANESTYEEEYRIMNDFVQFIRSRGNPKLWYWHADKMIWERSENRQMDLACQNCDTSRTDYIVNNWKLSGWTDLCQVFREEPIVIKGCFKFGLKEIAEAMYKNNLITTKLESDCASGLDASIMAWEAYKHPNPADNPIILDIAKYNTFDVSVLHDILCYLRK